MVTRASGVAGWEIATQGRSALLAHAGKELRQHLAHLAPAAAPGRIVLSHSTGDDDSFSVVNTEDQLTLHGAGPRGVLNATYWLLEQAGFVWVGPGAIGARIGPATALPAGTYRSAPASGRRTLVLGQDALHDDWREWMEWASRNRLNDIFFHDTPPSVWNRDGAARPERHGEIERDGRGWMFELWDCDGAIIAAEAAKRGMTIQFGGHHLPALLPRELFAEHPDWFPLRAGKREGRFNVCVSAAGAVELMQSAAAEFFERFAGADIYHLWADDIRGGGWCECDGCAAMSPSDQALRATNIVAEVLATTVPGAHIAHLAYHDTLHPPTTIAPHENVICLFAPRERCYAHAIDDESCARNRDEYWRPYNGLLRTFGGDKGRVSIFEYYSDAILFKGMAPMHLDVLPRDAAAYAPSAHNLQNLMVGPRPWLGSPWHAWWMAKCAWNPAAPVEEELARFWSAVDAAHAEELRAYATRTESAYRRFLDLHDLQGARGRDVLDFSETPRGTMRLKVAEAAAAARELAAAVEALPEPAEDAEALNREALQGYFVALVAEHLSDRLAGWAAAVDDDADSARSYIASARTALARIKEFEELFFDGSVGGSPAYANLGPRMWRGMELLTDAVERLPAGAEKA